MHIRNGLEAPLESKLNPTSVINHALDTEVTPGVQLARWVNKNGAAVLGNSTGEAVAGGVGAGLGALVGHPLVGAWAGERVLAPIFSALAKPLAENAINAEGARASVDYVSNVIKGQKELYNSINGLFKPGAEVLSNELIPKVESRDRLKKSLEHASNNPESLINIAGGVGHYLPNHSTAAASAAANGISYLNSLKPKQAQNAPLDAKAPVDKAATARYDRALDIAQQPLMVLKHLNNGALQAQDVQTLDTIYPGLKAKMVDQITKELTDDLKKGSNMPYAKRTSLNLLMGGGLDSTMTQASMHAIMASSAPPQAPQSPGKPKKASGTALSQINKVNKLALTSDQARAADKRS